MANDDTLFTRIEAYLAEQMTKEEQLAFEKEIESDASLAEEVNLQRDTHAILNLNNQVAWKEKLKVLDAKIETEMVSEKKVQRIPLWSRTYMRAAAVILLLITSGYFFIRSSYNDQHLIGQAFDPYPDILTVKGGEDTEDILPQAMAVYNQKNYQTAIPMFQQLLSDKLHEEDVRFYLANALMATNQPAEALPLLDETVSLNTKYNEVAPWLAALACLQAEITDACMQRLEAIANSESFYAAQAKDLLSKLDSPWRALPGI